MSSPVANITYVGYDLDDPVIRDLINTGHTISERKVDSMEGSELTVVCSVCMSPWPCVAVVNLRAWVAANP